MKLDPVKFFKGQKVELSCPKCEHTFKIDASKVFTPRASVVCTGCQSTVDLDNQEAIKELKKQLVQLQKLFK